MGYGTENKLIAIDFDDTITNKSPYPITGTLNKRAEKYIRRFSKMGFILILWTGRKGKYYDEAVDLINRWNLPIICVNHTEKLVADMYIDNKNYVFGRIPWLRLYLYQLIKKTLRSKK